MANDLAVIEQNLTLALPTLEQALPRMSSLSPERLMRTAIMAAEKTPKILTCTMASIVNSTVTAAVIGLEVDGVTGQGFLVPFDDKGTPKCQFMMGYKGYPTIAHRSGLSISSGVVREGDHFECDEGKGYISHIKKGDPTKRIIWTWAKLAGSGIIPVIKSVSRDEIEQVRKKSRAASSGFSPWQDEHGPGFAAMAEKTAIRRIGRNMPVIAADASFHRAAALEGAQEGGAIAYLRPDGALDVHHSQADPAQIGTRPPEFRWTMADDTDRVWKTAGDWARSLAQGLEKASDENLQAALDRNTANLKAVIDAGETDAHMTVMRVFVDRAIFPTTQSQGK